MYASSSTQKSHYAFGSHDRVTIENVPYRLHQQTEVGCVFIRDDETRLAQQFSHEELLRLGNDHRIRVEKGYFDPHYAAKQQLKCGVSSSALVGGAKTRMTKREAYVQGTLGLYHKKLLKITDASLLANMQLIKAEVMDLADNLNPSQHL